MGEAKGARAPPVTACSPHFSLLKILFLDHHVTRQQTMMEKGIVTFKYNSRLTFLDFCKIACNQLLYINVTQ